MQYGKQDLVTMLRKAGLVEEADAAVEELPDPVGLHEVQEWGLRRGITRDRLISWIGGSP